MKSIKITVLNSSGEQIASVDGTRGKTILSILQEQQIYLDAPCGGKGICKKCRVKVTYENFEAESGDTAPKECLACRTVLESDCTVQLSAAGTGEQIIAAVSENTNHGEDSFSQGREGQMQGNRRGSGYRRACTQNTDGYGIAVDIGTTTIAAALIHLPTGKQAGVMTGINRQRMYGADVLTRIAAANDGKLAGLQKCLQSDLVQMFVSLLAKSHTAASSVKKIVIAANTTMCHLLLGYSCRTLGEAPFVPVDISLTKKTYREVFHASNLTAQVTILPGISAFIGADIVAGIYACDLMKKKSDTLFLDIGTNGEMAVGGSSGFCAAAAAAGPVFEGGGISCGVPAVFGAVSHISIKPDGTVSHLEHVGESGDLFSFGGKRPVGICGAGVIDLIAGLIESGIVDENGLLSEPYFSDGFPFGGGMRFMQSDIRAFQMGKAAIRAGIETIVSHYYGGEKSAFDISLAGGFGAYMDTRNAVKTGLFPTDFTGRVKVVGNSALKGAIRYLREEDEEALHWIVESTEVITLAQETTFSDSYFEYMSFS